jgi:hypothetical protein
MSWIDHMAEISSDRGFQDIHSFAGGRAVQAAISPDGVVAP